MISSEGPKPPACPPLADEVAFLRNELHLELNHASDHLWSELAQFRKDTHEETEKWITKYDARMVQVFDFMEDTHKMVQEETAARVQHFQGIDQTIPGSIRTEVNLATAEVTNKIEGRIVGWEGNLMQVRDDVAKLSQSIDNMREDFHRLARALEELSQGTG